MTDLNIETITNNLAVGYNKLEKGTFLEASEVQNLRRTNHALRKREVYTANLPLFRIHNRCLEYGLGGMHSFDDIAGADIGEFTKQILNKGGYKLTSSQVDQLESLDEPESLDVFWVKASDLKLKKDRNDTWSYILIDTSDVTASKLNDSQRFFAVKAHGSLELEDVGQELPDYEKNMNMLREEGKINETRIWLPTPDHIEDYIEEMGVVARACRILDFRHCSVFDAGNRRVDDHHGLCAVPIGYQKSAKLNKITLVNK